MNENEQTPAVQRHKKRFNLLEYIVRSGGMVYSTLCRFPMAIILFIALAALTVFRVEAPNKDGEWLDRITGVLVLGIFLTLSVQVAIERIGKRLSLLGLGILYVVQIGLLVLYGIYLFPNTDVVPLVRLLMLIFALNLSFLSAPYYLNKRNFEIFITKIITRLTISAIFTIVLVLGLMAVLFAVKSLLYSTLNSDYYLYVWIMAWLVFAPVHFLSGFPKRNDCFDLADYNKALKILLFYIVLPILSIYTTVLYIYFVKIIASQIWPKGIVSYLVLSYTAVGIISVFLISPFLEISKWVKVFTAAFTKLSLPLLAMMFVSIGMRIRDFGVTENRYFVLVAGIWAALAVLFLNFNRGTRNVLLFVSLAITAVITVATPISAFQVSILSQTSRLGHILEKYSMLQNGKVVNNNSAISEADQQEITEILRYFKNSHEFNDIKYLPPAFSTDKMKTVFGFEWNDKIGRPLEQSYFSYSKPDQEPTVITGYNLLFKLQAYNSEKSEDVYSKSINGDNGNVKLVVDNRYVLSLSKNGKELYKLNLLQYLKAMYDKEGGFKSGGNSTEKLMLHAGNDKAEIQVIVDNLSGSYNRATSEFKIVNLNADVLVKLKS
jgi:hypothetical protein